MTNYKLAFLLAACLCGGSFATAACSSGDPVAGAQSKAAAEPKADADASGDSVGVAECDGYLATYETCLKEKVPAAARDLMNSSFESTRASWRQAAATPEGRAGLAAACKTARDTARQAMASYGCQF